MFVISCSLAALFQTTRIRMPHVAYGKMVVLNRCLCLNRSENAIIIKENTSNWVKWLALG
jgi:hypothetical protein